MNMEERLGKENPREEVGLWRVNISVKRVAGRLSKK